MRKKLKNKGFTLIELVMVIATLGILAVFALPRYSNLITPARTNSANQLRASLNSAIAIAHAQWIVNGNPSTVTLDNGASIKMNNLGFPDIGGTIVTTAGCQTLLSSLLNNNLTGITVSYGAGACFISSTNLIVMLVMNSNSVI